MDFDLCRRSKDRFLDLPPDTDRLFLLDRDRDRFLRPFETDLSFLRSLILSFLLDLSAVRDRDLFPFFSFDLTCESPLL